MYDRNFECTSFTKVYNSHTVEQLQITFASKEIPNNPMFIDTHNAFLFTALDC